MSAVGLVIVIVLLLIIGALIAYNLIIYKKVKSLNNTNEKIASLRVLQDFMDTIGKDTSVDNKIKIINDILIQKYGIKYSTIVVFNGAEYILRASNVDERLWDTLKNLHTEDMFKDSIQTATPKYVTVNSATEKLTYQKTEMSRAKSAMFFPLYLDNIYIGYWIIESAEMHAFDNMDTSILGVIKENIISVLKTVSYQNTIENIYRIDTTTGLNSAEYLYGKAKNDINRYGKSTVCMFKIVNIMEINEKFGRDIGTKLIIDIVNTVNTSISSDYLFVRYMGPKFAIVLSGVEVEDTIDFIATIKDKIEGIKISPPAETQITKKDKTKKTEIVSPLVNFALATYYKGTGIEEVTKKLEEYLDNADPKENNINCI